MVISNGLAVDLSPMHFNGADIYITIQSTIVCKAVCVYAMW